MDTSALSLEQGPPLSVPLRFFVAAPLFGLAAAAWLAVSPQGAFLSRWTPHTLALTHLFALGFLLLTMLGALFQVLPVVAGATIARPRLVSTAVLALVGTGAAGLAYGLATFRFGGVALPIAGLLAGVFVFLAAGLRSLWRCKGRGDSVTGLAVAFAGLLLTALLGGLLVLGQSGVRLPFLRPDLTDLHLLAGLSSWALLLVASVAYQVVPMFYVTPPYPGALRRLLAPAVLALVLGALGATWAGVAFGLDFLRKAPLLLAVPPVVFAVTTLSLLGRRRRKRREPSVFGWRLACALTLASVALWLWAELAPPSTFPAGFLAGALAFAALCAVITGMLLKIVPFLVWFHLQALWMSRLEADPSSAVAAFVVPNLQDVVSERAGWCVLAAFLAAAATLLAAFVGPAWLARVAALPLGLYFGGLLYLPLRALVVYRRGVRALTGGATR